VDQVGDRTCRIRVRRTGTIPFPVTVEAATLAGPSARATITGETEVDSVQLELDEAPSEIRIDPDGILPMQSSDNLEMRRVFVRALGAVGPTPRFVEAATRHLEADPDPYVAAQLIERLFESGRYREIIEVSNRISAVGACTDRQTCLAALQVARALARTGDRTAARSLLQRIETALPSYGRAAAQRAALLRNELEK
jgi:hypothetical protein